MFVTHSHTRARDRPNAVPGVLVALLRMGLLAWFLFSLRSTIKATTERPKLLFYYKFGAIFTVYLLCVVACGWGDLCRRVEFLLFHGIY